MKPIQFSGIYWANFSKADAEKLNEHAIYKRALQGVVDTYHIGEEGQSFKKKTDNWIAPFSQELDNGEIRSLLLVDDPNGKDATEYSRNKPRQTGRAGNSDWPGFFEFWFDWVPNPVAMVKDKIYDFKLGRFNKETENRVNKEVELNVTLDDKAMVETVETVKK